MIGFMQGRLVPMVDGKIQAFPWDDWQEEFGQAESSGFRLMEWTLDQNRLHENPLLTEAGQQEIRALSDRHGLEIGSLTGDCFMHAPFWKAEDNVTREALKTDLAVIARACAAVGISMLVVPLVDGGKLESRAQEDMVVEHLTSQVRLYRHLGIKIVFESDFEPERLARFIARLDPESFGINYDTGNSAALGFDAAAEWDIYGKRVYNVHIKDRVLGGYTAPLGQGNADFLKAFGAMAKAGYAGKFILQTARAADGDHIGAICRYRDFAITKMKEAGLDV